MSLQAAKDQLDETRPHAAPGRPLLEAKNIRRTFGETIALDSCSVSVAPGEIHAVVGENGSGKSTLIKILSGIVSAETDVVCAGRLERERTKSRRGSAILKGTILVRRG